MFTNKTLYLVCTVSHGVKHQNIGSRGLRTGDFPWLPPPRWVPPVLYERTRGPHSPAEPRPQYTSMDPNLWNPKGPLPSLGRSPRWVAPARDQTITRVGSCLGTQRIWKEYVCASCVDHTVDGMLLPPIRHERSHIMYWNCGKNRLMSLSNVRRDGRAQSPSLSWIQLSKSAGVFL